MEPARRLVVLFDGECNLCNAAVRFLYRRDPLRNLSYANLQSGIGQQLLVQFSLAGEEFDSFVLVEPDHAYSYSSGALRALRYLRPPWPALGKLAGVIPSSLRDGVYRWIARRRYAWFGKTDFCQIPDNDLQPRFLT